MTAEFCQYSDWSPQWHQTLSDWRISWGRGGTRGPHHDGSWSTPPPAPSPGGSWGPDPFQGLTPSSCNSILSPSQTLWFQDILQKCHSPVSVSPFPKVKIICWYFILLIWTNQSLKFCSTEMFHGWACEQSSAILFHNITIKDKI